MEFYCNYMICCLSVTFTTLLLHTSGDLVKENGFPVLIEGVIESARK